jgi:ATP-dependent exoDNAse (exonuclease V) beta subunit
MGKGTLTIYSASAGSGKTYTLTGIYLTTLFKSRYNYRKILAVTFTNKATAEMKSRILDNLHKLSVGEKSDYLSGLVKTTNKPEEWIRAEAKEILNAILHDFSRFSVSTIDSFFQKILRAFAREAGLNSGFNIELDHSIILSSAVDTMIESASSDKQLLNWLTTYAMSNIDDEKSWNLKNGIIKLSQELFKEKFKILSVDERSNLENKKFLLEYIEKIRAVSSSFEKNLQDFGSKAALLVSEYNLDNDMFYRKGQGVPGFIKGLASGIVKEPNSYVREIKGASSRWSTGAAVPQLMAAINGGLGKTISDAIDFYDNVIAGYKSAGAVLSNIYALGILSDVLKKVHLITTTENSFLLSDAGEVLNLITREDQVPFIYEKTGSRFENFMIDEFQDTSIIQWNNFRPLIENSMAEGSENLIVGDVKQSIYRWRNSDWEILGSLLDKRVDNDRIISVPLATNFRSRSNIISFNNTLFSVIPAQIDEILAVETLPGTFRKLYSEAVQSDPGKKEGGYVRLEFIEDGKEIRSVEAVLEKLPGIIEALQDKGYGASDIGIIVRNGKEGALVLKKMIDYSNNCSAEKKARYNFNVVSNDSLLLSNSPAINFIVAVLAVVNEPSDMISRAMMLRFFLLAKGIEDADKVSLVSDNLIAGSRVYFPVGYEDFLDRIREMPLFESTESIIGFFGLGDFLWNVAYLNTCQDYIVSFTGNKNADIQSFLDWWKSTGSKKSVVLPGNQDAVRILTIHKSKGLEFRIVILPFLSWELDHMPSKQPTLWVKPELPPFNDLGIVPVKYGKELAKTIFSDYYKEEMYSVYIDNINLLYVALTRAKDAIFGFTIDNPKSEKTISGVLKNAVTFNAGAADLSEFKLNSFYNIESKVFEFGEIPENKREQSDNVSIVSSGYIVRHEMESLKLKLHGENYFSSEKSDVRKKINYGKLMHEVFEGINVPGDILPAVRKLVIDGKLPAEESDDMVRKVSTLIGNPQVAEWFMAGNEVLKEAGILLPEGTLRRPDRVIFKDGKTIVIDFKFGEERRHYAEQVNQYRQLLSDMGYKSIDAFIWYVDKDKIVPA